MNFNFYAFLFALGICLVSSIIAGVSANKQGREWLEKLNKPKFPFTQKMMNILGFVYCVIFGIILYNLFVSKNIVAIVLTVSFMLINSLAAFTLFRKRNLKLFFAISLIEPILLIVLVYILFPTNLILAILAIAYLIWLIYDFTYFYFLMKLNK